MQRSKKSLKKIKLLLLLMIVTIVLMITATYAWFSTQREVDITGMRLNVEVAESMQISLDGEEWTNSIEIYDMRQFYGTHTAEAGDTTKFYQAKKPDDGGNENYVPTELKPVSSAGTVSNGKLQLVKADFSGTALSNIALCTETDLEPDTAIGTREEGNANHPYLVFDMYLRNISARQTGKDPLLLNSLSKVWINTDTADDEEQEGKGVADTGLEYSARVGMIVYGNTISTTETGDPEGTENGKTLGEKIRGITSTNLDTAAIWEPNDQEHIQYVVDNNRVGITSKKQAVVTKAISTDAVGSTITDVYATNNDNLVEVNTFKPAYTVGTGVNTKTAITDVNNGTIGLVPNTISKVRVYIWLEGQDPDCIDLASTGDKLNINLKLTKDPYTEGVGGNSYAEEGTGSGSQGTGEIITAETLAALSEDEAAIHYGGYVTNYTAQDHTNEELGIGGWRIFHSDGSNIYLIADDYVNLTKQVGEQTVNIVPAGKNGKAWTVYDNFTRGFSLDPGDDYAGWSDISSSSIATKWLSQYVASGYTSTNTNMKATAYLLDTNQWSGFRNSSYADYAIGGPTIELFAASYNRIHETDIETQVSRETGYEIKWSTSSSYTVELRLGNNGNSLYVQSTNTNASAMWIASPHPMQRNALFYLLSNGNLQSNAYYSTSNGARPVVCLKSDIQLEKQQDETYLIVE